MKAGPVFAMIGLLAAGLWMVLMPTLQRGERIDPNAQRFEMRLGSQRFDVEQRRGENGSLEYHFANNDSLEELGWIDQTRYQAIVEDRLASWTERPGWERTLLGFFNITNWTNFVWVAVGLGGQVAFFGRMLIQWVVSEKSRKSQVPELFWWLSFLGGVCLFTYFVWRVDVVGVLGQSTGVVIYARNLRLIKKEKRRERRRQAEKAAEAPPPAAAAVPAEAS
ncbi:MAG: lipid-A-disaccharide synthase N-terminal domain-containing protein [Planctomycetota bacterium]